MVYPVRPVADPSVPSATTRAQIDVEDVAEYDVNLARYGTSSAR